MKLGYWLASRKFVSSLTCAESQPLSCVDVYSLLALVPEWNVLRQLLRVDEE